MKTAVYLQENLSSFASWLCGERKSSGTIEKYLRDIHALADWLDERELTKETATQWREYLLSRDYAPVTVNSMLAALNAYCRFAAADIHVKFVKVQRKLVRGQSRELTQREYRCLVETAYSAGNERLALLMETICASGIRYRISRRRWHKAGKRSYR